MEDGIFYLLVTIAILTYIYYCFTFDYNYWKKKGVPCVEGVLPGIGNLLPFVLFQKHFGSLCTQFYKSATEYSMVGFYLFGSPALLVRDPELVKSVLQTNFANFAKNAREFDGKNDPIISQNPFFLSGEAWKNGRARLTAALTTGKLRILSNSITHVCHKYAEYLGKQITENKGIYDVEIKSSAARLTGEIVAATGFGIEGHCFEDPVGPRTLREVALSTFGDGIANQLKLFCFFYCPSLPAMLGLKFLPRKLEIFFEKVCRSAIDARKEGSTGGDFIQIIIDQELKESKDVEVINKAVMSHMASFFVDVYETSSTTLAFILHQLSCHGEIQEKVREEIRSALAKNNGELTMETINDMPYMDRVIKESMRLNSAILYLVKVCTEKIALIGSDGLTCELEPGAVVYVPVDGLHKDPLYWENPMKFDPERFSPEAENARHKFVFLPFNEGPRNCPGRRLGRLVLKMALSILLMKFTVELSPKMKMPLEYMVLSFILYAKNGLWVTMKPLPSKKNVD